jgi:protocatechuate 3,4-dioxygenase beta subunit
MRFSSAVLSVLALATSVLAHPGGHHINRREISRRSLMGLQCRDNVAKLHERCIKRSVKRRWYRHNTNWSIHTEAPYFETIQDDTYDLTPEATQGPYVFPTSQILRQDITAGQKGVPLWLDIGVLNLATCEPLEDALIDMWHCNATGSYSSFTGLSPNTPFLELLEQLHINESDYQIGVTDLHTDETNFLRGMWPTDKNGMMEMKTIFTGKINTYPLNHSWVNS